MHDRQLAQALARDLRPMRSSGITRPLSELTQCALIGMTRALGGRSVQLLDDGGMPRCRSVAGRMWHRGVAVRLPPSVAIARPMGVHLLIGVWAVLALVLAGCGAATDGVSSNVVRKDAAPSASASVTPTVSPSVPDKPLISQPSVPAPGWAENVVPAGDAAYIVGWTTAGAGALWQVDAAGHLSRRTAPPGMPGNPGLAADDAIGFLVFDGPHTGLAVTGTSGEVPAQAHRALYVTDDAARTWTKVHLPTREQPDQAAAGGGAAYVLTNNCTGPVSACDHATLWTIDPTGAAAPHDFASLPRTTDTSGPNAIAAYGDSVWVELNLGAGRGTALRSRDGGRTWRRFDAGDCTWVQMTATSADVLWEACGGGMMQGFARQAGSSRPLAVFSGELGGTSNSALLPVTDATAYAVIDNRHGTRVEVTRDGGHTTTTVAPVPRSIARRGFRTTFVSEQVGYLITLNGGEVYRTGNGARSWQLVSPPGT